MIYKNALRARTDKSGDIMKIERRSQNPILTAQKKESRSEVKIWFTKRVSEWSQKLDSPVWLLRSRRVPGCPRRLIPSSKYAFRACQNIHLCPKLWANPQFHFTQVLKRRFKGHFLEIHSPDFLNEHKPGEWVSEWMSEWVSESLRDLSIAVRWSLSQDQCHQVWNS